ncbi:hypothetical protein VaNZ11_014504 [Volvox africanus]|uniref:DEAD/DEAH box helicase n=1 Tax=Volvox africanus TaxID=51714 RepID=A0ABQ5SK00_9CHLO|nr:hypothetical protein VaNZ11_014504 [Volvox africanus]
MPAVAPRAPHCYGPGAVGYLGVTMQKAMEECSVPASMITAKAVSTSAPVAGRLVQEPVAVAGLAPTGRARGAAAVAVGTSFGVCTSGRTAGLVRTSACAAEVGAARDRMIESEGPAGDAVSPVLESAVSNQGIREPPIAPSISISLPIPPQQLQQQTSSQLPVERERIHVMVGRVNVAAAAPSHDLFDELKAELEAATLRSDEVAGRQREEPADTAAVLAAKLAETAGSFPSASKAAADSRHVRKKAKQANLPPPQSQLPLQPFKSVLGGSKHKDVVRDRINEGLQTEQQQQQQQQKQSSQRRGEATPSQTAPTFAGDSAVPQTAGRRPRRAAAEEAINGLAGTYRQGCSPPRWREKLANNERDCESDDGGRGRGLGYGRTAHRGEERKDNTDAEWSAEEALHSDDSSSHSPGKQGSGAYGDGDGVGASMSQRRRRQRSRCGESAEAGKLKRRRGCSAAVVVSGIDASGAGDGTITGEAVPGVSNGTSGALSGMCGHRPRRPKVVYPRSGPLFQRAVADCVLPLPPSLERLQQIFRGVNALYTFLLGQQVQMTWDNSCEALRSQMPNLNITLDDLLLAAALVPEVLMTKIVTQGSVAADATCFKQSQHGAEKASAAGGCGSGGGEGSLRTLLAAQDWRTDLVDRAVHLDRLAEADGTAAGTTQGTSGGVLVELIDPRRASPLLYEEAPAAEAPAAEKPGDCGDGRGTGRGADQAKELVGDGDGGDKGVGTSSPEKVVKRRQGERRRRAYLARPVAPPVILEDGRRLRFATNVITRRLAAFRSGLVSVLQHLHADFVNRLAPTERSGTRSGIATIPANIDSAGNHDSTYSSETAPVTDAMAARPSQATLMAAAAVPACTAVAAATAANTAVDPLPGIPPWDPAARRDWHPLFSAFLRRDGITFQQLRSAAAELRARRETRAQNTAGRSGSQPRHGTAPRPPTLLKQYEPCVSSAPLTPLGLLHHLQELPWYKGQVVHVEVLPARPAAVARPTAPLASPVLRALKSLGINEGRLYTHQVDAVDALLGYDRLGFNCAQQVPYPHHPHHHPHHHGHQQQHRQEVEQQQQQEQQQQDGVPLPGQSGVGPGPAPGLLGPYPRSRGRHVVVATSTASGKSLCYMVPLMQALSEDPDACALLMFPTKALAQDQLRAIRGLIEAAFGDHEGAAMPAVEVYDGDTSMSERPDIRQRAQVVLTNPDMLHATVLPGHRQFSRLLSKLTLVVVDEGHAYGGVFGCHTAMVLRRLRRLCNHVYGTDPRFVMTSATVANPLQLASRLLGVDQTEITLVGPVRDGSPCALRRFVLWNPPLTERALKAAEVKTAVVAAAARAGSRMTRTEARAAARISRNAERARQRQLLQEARAARVRASQLATERLAGGAAGAAAQEEMLQLAAAAQPLQQLKEALFGGSPRMRRAAERRLAEVQTATVAAAAGISTASAAAHLAVGGSGSGAVAGTPEPVKLKEGEPDETKYPVRPVGAISPGRATKPVPMPPSRQAGPSNPGSGTTGQLELPPGMMQDVAAMAAQVRAALSAAVDVNIEGNRRQISSLVSLRPVVSTSDNTAPVSNPVAAVAAASAVDSMASEIPPTAQASRPLILRTSGLAAAAAALGLPLPEGGGAGAADSRVVRELLSRLPGPEWREKHGAAGTPLEHRRDSPIVEMALLLAECVQHGLRTIAFCKSRKLCELVMAYTRETLVACAPGYEGRVKVYRAGYSPAERRAMEADIHSGRLLALAATNALELGVDVGGLDVTLHLGFPGSVASLRQQAGRAGRREQESLSLVVGFDGPLDQHFMRHPEHLFGRPVESVQIDVHNPDVLQQHLLCAALEHPLLLDQDLPFFGCRMPDIVARVLAASLICRHPGAPFGSTSGGGSQEWGGIPAGGNGGRGGGGGGWDDWLSVPLIYSGPKDNPASAIYLRSIDPDRFVIWDETTRMPLEEIEANMAFYEVYDGAVYMFQGRPYLCRQLNLSERVAIVRPADVKYYTKVKDYTDVYVTGGHVAYPAPTPALHRVMGAPVSGPDPAGGPGSNSSHRAAAAVAAPVLTEVEKRAPCLASAVPNEAASVTATATAKVGTDTSLLGTAIESMSATTASCESALVVVRYLGFHRVWQGSNRLFDTVDLFLPDVIYETQAAYVRVPPSARHECSARNLSFREGCHAANHALLNVVPLFLIANARDLGTECDNPYDARYRVERLLVYDKHRGGMGLSVAAAPLFPALLERAHRLVSECSCPYAKGCPQCVQHLECRNYNAVLSKTAAEVVLRHVLEQERAHVEVEATGRRGFRGTGRPERMDEKKGKL